MKLILPITLLILLMSNILKPSPSLDELETKVTTDIISYELNPGRLGDHLLTYVKAKIASLFSGLPNHCPQFEWSDHLALSQHEKYFSLKKYDKVDLVCYTRKKFNKKTHDEHQATKSSKPTAYICSLKTKIEQLSGFNSIYEYVRSNQSFKDELLRMIAPIKPVKQLDIPEDMISVAIHVRTGGTFEKTSLQQSNPQQSNTKLQKNLGVDRVYPTRFPPEKYYIEQLKYIADILKQPLFVHIFTDDTDPLAMVARFKSQLSSKYPITFSCRTKKNGHNLNVLYDLFNMACFDCLIRPASSFSKIAQLLGDHRIIIYPAKAIWVDNQVIVKKVAIINHYND